MSGTEGGIPPSDGVRIQKGRGLIPPQILELIVPPVEVGTWCGGAGMTVGSVAAIMTDSSPWMSAAMTGTQWAVLGTTYWFSRLVAMRTLVGERDPTPFDRIKASAAAAIPTGGMLSLSLQRAKGNRALGSSIVFCTLTASGGQWIVNTVTGGKKQLEDDSDNGHWLGGRWSPLKQLSDEEYTHKIDEKILRVDADIALIDERIAKLREQQQPPEKPDQ